MNETLAVPAPVPVSRADSAVGGANFRVIEADGDEYADEIPELVAIISNVYAPPGVNPDTDAVLPEMVYDVNA